MNTFQNRQSSNPSLTSSGIAAPNISLNCSIAMAEQPSISSILAALGNIIFYHKPYNLL